MARDGLGGKHRSQHRAPNGGGCFFLLVAFLTVIAWALATYFINKPR